MPWFAVPVAIATAGLLGKLLSRHLHGREASAALEDPPGVRTIAQFELAEGTQPADVLLAVAAEVARDLDHRVEVTADAVRARPHPLAARADVVRLARVRGDTRAPASASASASRAFTLELTRAWTGALLDDASLALLLRVHDALVSLPGVRHLAWHARQDRTRAERHVFPFEAPTAPLQA